MQWYDAPPTPRPRKRYRSSNNTNLHVLRGGPGQDEESPYQLSLLIAQYYVLIWNITLYIFMHWYGSTDTCEEKVYISDRYHGGIWLFYHYTTNYYSLCIRVNWAASSWEGRPVFLFLFSTTRKRDQFKGTAVCQYSSEPLRVATLAW